MATPGLRWSARGLSAFVAGAVVLFLVGEGGFDPLRLTGEEALLMVVFGTAWFGLLVAWRWEVLGAGMTLGGVALFYLVEWLHGGRFPRGWAFAAIALPGVLFLYCGLRPTPSRRRSVP